MAARTQPLPCVVEIGRMLRHCREAAGMTLRDLEAETGYDHTYIHKIESGQRFGFGVIEVTRALASALDMPETSREELEMLFQSYVNARLNV